MAADRNGRTLGDYFTLQRGTTYKSRLLGLPGPVLSVNELLANILAEGELTREATIRDFWMVRSAGFYGPKRHLDVRQTATRSRRIERTASEGAR